MKTTFPYTPADIAELAHQCALLGLDPLAQEQIDLLTAPTLPADRAADRIGMLEDLRDRCGVEIFTAFDETDARNRHRLMRAEANRDARAVAPKLSAVLLALGFGLVPTGGGCYAWATDRQGNHTVVTHAESPNYPADTLPAMLSVYATDDDCEPIAQTEYPTGAELAEKLATDAGLTVQG